MEPLIKWRPVRGLVAVAAVTGMAGAVALAWHWFIWLFNPLACLGALAGLGAALISARALWRGSWNSATGRGAALLLLAVLIGAAAQATSRAIEEQRVRDIGVPTEAFLSFYAGAGGVALVSAAVLLAAAPPLVSKRLTVRACAILVVLGSLGLGMAVTTHASTSCADDRIDPEAWRAAREDDRPATVTRDERIAQAIVDCRLLHGHSRDDVRAALGPPERQDRRRWYWTAGWVHDGLGPGDGQELVLWFDRQGRVVRARLAYESWFD